jgi:hypothetical protein
MEERMYLRIRVTESRARLSGNPVLRVFLRDDHRRDAHIAQTLLNSPDKQLSAEDLQDLFRRAKGGLLRIGFDNAATDYLLERLWTRLVTRGLVADPMAGPPTVPDLAAEWLTVKQKIQRAFARFRFGGEVRDACSKKNTGSAT